MVFPYKASGLETNRISYKIFDIRHVSIVAAHFQKKKRNAHKFIPVSKRREAAEPYLKPCQISIMDLFCNLDVCFGS